MIKTVKISKVNINEPKTGSTNGKDWKAWPVGICVDDVWHNAFLFDKDFVDELGVSESKEITLDFYTEEYQGEDQNKFKQVTKNDIINMRLDALEKKVFGKTTELKEVKTAEKPTINVFVQKKADMFKEFLKDNEDKLPKDIYDTSKKWIEDLDLEKANTKQLTVNLDKIKKQIIEPKTESGKYESYHEELITACCETLKTKDRLPIIQTLNNMVKGWNIEGTEKLSDASENECLNLLEQFDNQLKEEDSQNLPY
jgi:hypothetical protein